jgi:hypothetical protein
MRTSKLAMALWLSKLLESPESPQKSAKQRKMVFFFQKEGRERKILLRKARIKTTRSRKQNYIINLERHNRKATNMLDMYAWNMSKYNTGPLKQHQIFCFPTRVSSSEQWNHSTKQHLITRSKKSESWVVLFWNKNKNGSKPFCPKQAGPGFSSCTKLQ